MSVCVFCVCAHIYVQGNKYDKNICDFFLANTGHGVAFSAHVAFFIADVYFTGICAGRDTLKGKAVKLPAQSDSSAFCTL